MNIIKEENLNLLWEREEEYKFSEEEIRLAETFVNIGYKYMTRDKNNSLNIFTTNEIEKFDDEWIFNKPNTKYISLPVYNDMFKNVKWEDEEPFDLSKVTLDK